MVRVLIVIPTYEPVYVHDPELEEFYTQNFDSFLSPEGEVEATVVLSDFSSSRSFKRFLRGYVASRNGCLLVDGEQEASNFVAFNIPLRSFEYEYAVYAASDARARDTRWLEGLLRDFDDPAVSVVAPTVTFDGLEVYEQTQPGPSDRESRVLRFPECFNLHCAVFSRRFLSHFDSMYPDIFDTSGSEYCLMYQLAAVNSVSKLNFRVNLIHQRFQPGRYEPERATSRTRSNRMYEADRQKFETRRLILPQADFFASPKVGLISRLGKHVEWIRSQGWRYFFHRYFARRAFDNFCRLDVPTKVAMVKALFYRHDLDYDQYTYSLRGRDSEILQRSSGMARSLR